MLPFTRHGLKDQKSNPRPGDVVQFRVATEKRNGKKTAAEVEVVRFEGVVASVKSQGSYGFLEHDGDEDEDEPEPEPEPLQAPLYGELSCVPSQSKEATGEKDPGAGGPDDEDPNGDEEPPKKKKKKVRVFFHGSEVENNVVLKEGDEVTYAVTMPRETHGGGRHRSRGDGPGGGGKDPTARRVVRTKEAPEAVRPTFTNTRPGEEEGSSERPAGTNFSSHGSRFIDAKGPDGTRGFSMGRGAGLAEAASAAVSKLKLAATPFKPPPPNPVVSGGAAGANAPERDEDVELAPEQTEDAPEGEE